MDRIIDNPRAVAETVADIIEQHPDRHSQGAWIVFDVDQWTMADVRAEADRDYCGTIACVAGWAAIVAAPGNACLWGEDEDRLWLPDEGMDRSVLLIAKTALGLSIVDAAWLFDGDRTTDEVLSALRSLAAGRPMTRLPAAYRLRLHQEGQRS